MTQVLFCFLHLVGLVWCLVFYKRCSRRSKSIVYSPRRIAQIERVAPQVLRRSYAYGRICCGWTRSSKSVLQLAFCYYYGMHAKSITPWVAAATCIQCKTWNVHAQSRDACYVASGIALTIVGAEHPSGRFLAVALNHVAPLFPGSARALGAEGEGFEEEEPIAATVYFMNMSDVRDNAVNIKPSELSVQFDDGDLLPQLVRQEAPPRMLAVGTNGNGACGMHAVLGYPDGNRELLLPNAREIAVQALRLIPTMVLSLASGEHAQAVQVSLWDEFVRPCLEGNPGPEATMFWSSLNAVCPELAAESQAVHQEAKERSTRFDAAKKDALRASRSCFFIPEMEEHYVRRLAVQFDYVPRGMDVFALIRAGQEVSVGGIRSSFLESAQTEDGFVKGTRTPFPSNGPSCRYLALFDQRPCFDALRMSFVVDADPESGPRVLIHALATVLEGDDVCYTYVDKAITFVEKLREWNERSVSVEKPVGFPSRAWPAYLHCIREHSNYYFSVEEILLVSARAQINLAIFQQIDNNLSYAGGTFDGVGPIVYAKLLGNRRGVVRSHFERLIPVQDAVRLYEEVAADLDQREAEREEAEAQRAQEQELRMQREKELEAEKRRKREEELKERGASEQEQRASRIGKEADDRALAEHQMQEALAAMQECGLEQNCSEREFAEAGEEAAEPGAVQQEDEPTMERSKITEWWSMFQIKARSDLRNRSREDLLNEAAKRVADLLRDHPTMPADPKDSSKAWTDASRGGKLPVVSCAFQGCIWCGGRTLKARDEQACRDDPEHPWDQELREHILTQHADAITTRLSDLVTSLNIEDLYWDLYKEAIAVKERSNVPIVGPSVDRRATDHLVQMFNDQKIKSLICFACAQIKVDTGVCRSEIEYVSAKWLLNVPPKVLWKKFSMEEFQKRYCKPGTPLARSGNGNSMSDVAKPDFTDWQIHLTAEAVEEYIAEEANARKLGEGGIDDLRQLARGPLLCCPEDMRCTGEKHAIETLCLRCRFPLCRSCQLELQKGAIIPAGLANDNWYGYVQAWIYEVGVTWMEKTVATPFWTGLTLFSVREHRARRRHLLYETMYQASSRVAFKGQVFSAPMDWTSMLQQLQEMEKKEALIALPHTGSSLASMVKIQMSSGLVDLNKHLKHVTVRRHVVVQLIRMFRDAGHADYQRLDMRDVERRARLLADSDDPSIPHGLAEVLESNENNASSDDGGVDKAATPAERIRSAAQLSRNMDRARPNILFAQRDSDARKEIEASRTSAFSTFSELDLRTGSKLLDQFQGSYIPRVFHLTLPWCVGGPDLRGRERFRRSSGDAPALTLDEFTAMLPRRVEAQMRWDWDLVPAVWSLRFATKVNLGASLSIKRTLRGGEAEISDEKRIGAIAAKVYKLLIEGEYTRPDGSRQRIEGDTSKLLNAIGLTQTQRSMVQNYYFMSTRISGTRQIRRSINHLVFSSRVKYGLPIFMTVTPSERHSGLAIHLSRYRRNDPAIQIANPEFLPWIGPDAPSLQAAGPMDADETVTLELPEYDLRRLMTSRDCLCSVNAYKVSITVIVARLFGLRMCPECPHCALCAKPCMDIFGSNATPMGGSAGRADALIGATEAQKAEGVLHLHFFIFIQMAHQFLNLSEISDLLRERLMTVDSLGVFHNHLRCAMYPDVAKFESEKLDIEKQWPAYADDRVLSRPPAYVWDALQPNQTQHLFSTGSWDVWREEGQVWLGKRAARLQHVLSHMNHHIHPLVNASTGERRPLGSCRPKNHPKECKGGFPLE